MAEFIAVADQYYIHVTSSRVDDRSHVLKAGDTFAVFDRHGDIHPYGRGRHGLYHEGTRFLSRCELEVGGERPLLLSSTVKQDNSLLAVDLTNPDLENDGEARVPADLVHVFRSVFLRLGVCYQRVRVRSHALESIQLRLTLRVAADFADIFEVRGTKRAARGRILEPELHGDGLTLRYVGLDSVDRATTITAEPQPSSTTPDELTFELRLEPHTETVLLLTMSCSIGELRPRVVSHADAIADAAHSRTSLRAAWAEYGTSHEGYNEWLQRSSADLSMMLTQTPQGWYPYAGVPWFSTVFGRDGIITAWQTLLIAPEIAAGVLRHLAATQAQTVDPERDAEPGKILHEARAGEMAALREIPFGRYYGSVDSTPLFVMLAAGYHERTGDLNLVRELWPNLEAALQWMDQNEDLNGSRFLVYRRQSDRGLVNQGWKDSQDSVFHADGTLARRGVALCEVQAYAYAARRGAARLARALRNADRAAGLEERAERLRAEFDRSYWCEDLGTYALALEDGVGPCRVRSSNAGHTLFGGIATGARAGPVAQALMDEDSWSGWGIRTVPIGAARYNPMSYHNGSVWPHDNALIAQGLASYGYKDAALRILEALFEASRFLDLQRLPELYCGFPRRPGEGPTLYPVACMPQAWAVAAPYLCLQACLGLSVDGSRRLVTVERPALPAAVDQVTLTNLRLGEATVDLQFARQRGGEVAISVQRLQGEVQIRVIQ